jgi:DNA modification methylase
MDISMTEHQIILGNALEKLQDFPVARFDVVITDPPYNLGKNYGNNHDNHDFHDYIAFTKRWVQECARVLKPTGTLYSFMGFRFISHLFNIMEEDADLQFVNWIVWHYTQGIGKTRGFSPRHDDILMFSKTDKFKFNLDSVRVPQKYYRERNNMRGANPGDVWQFSHVHYCHENRQAHPTQKPEGLIERMVLASSDVGDWVLDPFSGSGTTLRVCQQLDRNCIGIEMNPDFVQMTEARLGEQFQGFDSIDPRMERVPMDLRQKDIRELYLSQHKQWFLKHHENAEAKLMKSVKEIYGKS